MRDDYSLRGTRQVNEGPGVSSRLEIVLADSPLLTTKRNPSIIKTEKHTQRLRQIKIKIRNKELKKNSASE